MVELERYNTRSTEVSKEDDVGIEWLSSLEQDGFILGAM